MAHSNVPIGHLRRGDLPILKGGGIFNNLASYMAVVNAQLNTKKWSADQSFSRSPNEKVISRKNKKVEEFMSAAAKHML